MASSCRATITDWCRGCRDGASGGALSKGSTVIPRARGVTVTKRTKRQHTVSKFYLRGFASDTGTVMRYDLAERKAVPLSLNDASVVNDFYSVTLPDGSLSDIFEKLFSEIEGDASAALEAVLDGDWQLRGLAREGLANWFALQYLRSEQIRAEQTHIASEMIRLLVGISGKEALRKKIQRAEGRSVGDEELDREWADLTKEGGPKIQSNVEQHIDTIMSLVPGTAAYFYDSHWTVVRFQRRSLVTADSPVTLHAEEDHPAYMGVGIFNAGLFAVPLSRRTVMTIQPRYRLEEYGWEREFGLTVDQVPDFEIPGTTKQSWSFNQAAVLGARRFIYHHPDDAPLGPPITLPDGAQSEETSISSTDALIREEGLYADQRPHEQPVSTPAPHGDRGVSLDDLPWPIPGRRAPSAN